MLLTTIRSHRALSANRSTRRAAFTLLEVLIVVAILVILASAASIALFRYLEDAKVGRAKTDMRVIEQAYQKYYIENNSQWPTDISAISPQLQQGDEGLLDPWGNRYSVEIIQGIQQTDGTTIDRPIVKCQPPNNRPIIQWPEK